MNGMVMLFFHLPHSAEIGPIDDVDETGAKQLNRWFPWLSSQRKFVKSTGEEECVEDSGDHSSIDEFPEDLFTRTCVPIGSSFVHFPTVLKLNDKLVPIQ